MSIADWQRVVALEHRCTELEKRVNLGDATLRSMLQICTELEARLDALQPAARVAEARKV